VYQAKSCQQTALGKKFAIQFHSVSLKLLNFAKQLC
jgi:hypothetical protein